MRIAFVGDVNLSGKVVGMLNKHGLSYPFAHVNSVLREADLRIANLECCLVDSTCGRDAHEARFAVPTYLADSLLSGGINVVNLANNHILDAGSESVRCAIDYFRSIGVTTIGAGANIAEAGEIKTLCIGGKTIALIGACDRSSCFATESQTGVLPLSSRILKERVRQAAKMHDLIVVSVHADVEFSDYPAPWRVKQSRWLIEQGAHLVIGHHPHVTQGIEYFKNGLIAYSLGNFVFEIAGNRFQERYSETRNSFILNVDIEFPNMGTPDIAWDYVPVSLGDDHRPRIMEQDSAKRFKARVESLSAGLLCWAKLRYVWRRSSRRKVRSRIMDAYYKFKRGEKMVAVRMIVNAFRERESRAWVVGYLTRGRV